ncbi:hypothetical protein [Oceanobacillus damuensis]|uniref:hypothetical protein n=1 Tax=Oceanobacillus damuensis TaxID=937928 RepID=UPI000B248F03|nr:hypothetical protein [Oceanobacillus damuensis]
MNKVLDSFRNLFMDLFSAGKGFLYGFTIIGLFLVVGAVLLYGILSLRNFLF